MWPQQAPTNNPQNVTRKIQGLVREARCYPPERESRIIRDVYDCCRHFTGLRPKLEYCVFDSNQTVRILALEGVIPITYRSNTYQIPICIWCMPHYPNENPVPYVRPTAAMVIRERHSHVDKEGRVYLPYLSNWDPTQFTFYGVVVAMIRVFSVEPPVNSKPLTPSPRADEPERHQLILALSKRMSVRLADVSDEAIKEIGQLMHKKEEMIKSDKSATEEMRQKATAHKAAEDELERITIQMSELDAWVKTVGSLQEEREIDEMLRYKDILEEQAVSCSAEDLAYSDALDQVDEAFVQGVIDHETYIRNIRELSRQQFFPRALKRKIELAHARKGQVDAEGVPRRLKSTRVAPMYAV